MSNINDKTVGRGTSEPIRSGTSHKTSNGNDGRTENPHYGERHGDSAIDEVVQVHYNGGSSLSINVSRDSKMQLVDDVIRGLGGNDKVSVASTLKDFIKALKQGEPGNDVRIFFPKSWREDIEFGIERIEHNVGGFAETDIILKKV